MTLLNLFGHDIYSLYHLYRDNVASGSNNTNISSGQKPVYVFVDFLNARKFRSFLS